MIEWVAGYELRVAGHRLHGSRLAFGVRRSDVAKVMSDKLAFGVHGVSLMRKGDRPLVAEGRCLRLPGITHD
jgi:hypothetical protein